MAENPSAIPVEELVARARGHSRHVNLGCNYGAHLDDGGLLEGTGRNMRKMTVRTVDALDDPRLVPLLRAARQERPTALGRT